MGARPHLYVVTPTWNCCRYVEATLRSLATQQLTIDHEVVDGGSTDGTLEVVRRWHGTRLAMQTFEHRTMYAAVDQGLSRATAPWCTYLNGDDLAFCDAYRRLIEVGEATGADVVYGDACVFRNEGGVILPRFQAASSDHAAFLSRGSLPFVQPSAIFRHAMWRDLGGLRRELRLCGDLDFFVRAWDKGFRFQYVPSLVVSGFRVTGESLGDKQGSAAEAERRRIAESVRPSGSAARFAWARATRAIASRRGDTQAERAHWAGQLRRLEGEDAR